MKESFAVQIEQTCGKEKVPLVVVRGGAVGDRHVCDKGRLGRERNEV